MLLPLPPAACSQEEAILKVNQGALTEAQLMEVSAGEREGEGVRERDVLAHLCDIREKGPA